MAEVKNSFLKSKMNQDLDDRLIPNGEYRYAKNISVGKSEADDIGALENVLGNEILPLTIPDTTAGMECIGAFMDNQNNRIFQFLTNYTDGDEITSQTVMKIVMLNLENTPAYYTLVEGLFLNFSKGKEFLITGVNLIEGLLFWTDNRNQPRKINVSNAINNPNYYVNETQISVAKYAPVDPISLYRKITTVVTDISSATEFGVEDATGITIGMTVISDNISGSEYVTVTDVDYNNNIVFIYGSPTVPTPPPTINVGDELTFLGSTMSDKSEDPNWPGDPNFLEDKYVRFSYRFKYDDNEYSLMAPFTQIAYIPKQKGFFIAGNETAAYRSTVIDWFENNINNIELLIPLPDRASNLLSSYKIAELDILYKESDSTAVKVFKTIPVTTIAAQSGDSNVFVQAYQSQKPYKTLPEDQTIRVYDKVPVIAKAQESAGNRIIYGNYFDRYTPPATIDYNVSVQPKSDLYTSFIEYPNHTLKQNRNYQIGFILADKFGRQSSVLLSSNSESVEFAGRNFGASTIYSKYSTYGTDVRDWFGNALVVIVNSPITGGQCGLYAVPTNNLGFAINFATISGNTYSFSLDPSFPDAIYIPQIGDSLRGKYTDYVEVTNVTGPVLDIYQVTTSDEVSDIYLYNDPGFGLPDTKFAYAINPIGWYSYKVVVRQQQQDYYNVYLPGMLNGYPVAQTFGSQVTYDNTGQAALENGIDSTTFPVGETNKTAHIVLINDNINKVPRDLSEVGPDQKQYRSSVQLYGRVENVEDTSITITGDGTYPSAFTNKITYNVVTNPDYVLVKPGDGIQCTEANTPLPGPPEEPNPNRWYANTVVVSNEIVGTTGTITFEPSNAVLNTYVTFPITRAENLQYFPTRKADTVNSIATAAEFNFLDNTVNNIKGTAGLNFYQLQNKPLIGRISTTNKIGVVAKDMIPFLSVYETEAQETMLDLFWETSTTGLISDLNTDVNTGYNGPVGFTTINYTHFENQNPAGAGTTTGAPNSKWITDTFYPKNASGLPLMNTTMSIASIVDGTNVNRISDFGLYKDPGDGSYRLKILNPFVFNNNAALKESYVFVFNVTDLSSNISTQLSFTGRLSNSAPSFSEPSYSYNITQSTTTIATLIGYNGSYSGSNSGLQWRIMSGDTTPSSFAIDPQTGVLSLTNSAVGLGIYELVVRLTDAVDFSVNPPLGTTLTNTNPNYASKYVEKTITINVGNEPVPYWLRQNAAELFIYNSDGANIINTPTPYPYKYGIAYIGNKDITLDSNGQNPNLPIAPDSLGKYQQALNMEIENAALQDPPVILTPSLCSGLTQGTLKWTVKVRVNAPETEETKTSKAKGDIIIYYRDQTTPGGAWNIVNDDNNVGFSTTWESGTEGQLDCTRTTGSAEPTQIRTTTFTTTNPSLGVAGEWAIAVRIYDYGSPDVTPGNSLSVKVEDSNFTYTSPDWNTPIVNAYPFYTGVEYTSYVPVEETIPSGIPYTTQDARRSIQYTSPNTTVTALTNVTGNVWEVTIQDANEQLVKGLSFFVNAGSGEVQTVISSTKALVNLNIGTISNGDTIYFSSGSNTEAGVVYAVVSEGTAVSQFYRDSNLTLVWEPPVADRFYSFWAGNAKDYNDNDSSTLPNHPKFCAKFDANGKVIDQVYPTYTVETYTQTSDTSKTGRNVYGFVGFAP